jgi:plastocyanin
MRRTPLLASGAAALVLLLAACSGDDGAQSTDTTAGSGSAAHLLVKANNNLTFDAKAYKAAAGELDITYQNTGSVAHTLRIDGVSGFRLAVGGKDEGSVTLDPGTYKLFCDVAGHEAAGMRATLTVT